ncbi:MAG: TolC family protein [Fibrobacteres bacterium]|nr:TolC family protein [Fibrobacterota bacterium]
MRFVALILLAAVLGTSAYSEENLKPVSILQVMHEVCIHSDSAKMMKESIDKAHLMVKEKYSAALPTVSASVNAARTYGMGMMNSGGASSSVQPFKYVDTLKTDTTVKYLSQYVNGLMMGLSNIGASKEYSVYGSAIQISQPLYTFGKIGTAVEVAKDFGESTKRSVVRSLQQLQLSALDGFYRVMLAEMAVNVTDRSLARKMALSNYLERNFKLGSGSKAQMLAAFADVKSEQSNLITARENSLVAKMMLNSMMGRVITEPLILDTSDILKSLAEMQLPETKSAVDSAITIREDLRSLESLKKANEGGAKIYRAMNLPSIGATGSLSFRGTEPGDIVNWDLRNWTLGVGLQWTLFDGFANSSKAKQFAVDGKKLEMAMGTLTKMIQIEVATAIAECHAADSNFAASKEMLAASQESYDLTNENFKQGGGLFVELQSAQERLRQAEMGFMNARYRLIRSRAALLVSMGKNIAKVEDL